MEVSLVSIGTIEAPIDIFSAGGAALSDTCFHSSYVKRFCSLCRAEAQVGRMDEPASMYYRGACPALPVATLSIGWSPLSDLHEQPMRQRGHPHLWVGPPAARANPCESMQILRIRVA